VLVQQVFSFHPFCAVTLVLISCYLCLATGPFLSENPRPWQLPTILAEVSQAISSVSRVTKRQGCSGLKDLAKTLGPSLGEESSGRRLIRRVLSQIPGRTWEGKDELLEAVVALCAAGKGPAITLEPFVWSGREETGGGGGAEGGGGGGGSGPASSGSRGVKRTRSSEPLGTGDDEQAEEEDDEADGAGASGTSASAGAGAKGSGGDDDSSDDNEAAGESSDGPAFEYQDKLGDLGEASATATASVTAAGAGMQTQPGQQPGAAGEPRKDAAALEAGLASLDMEDDSTIPFGEVASLMLSQLRRYD